MISLPKYQPLQWIIIDKAMAFAQIINASEHDETGWTYQVSNDGAEILHISENDIVAYQENGKWIKKSVATTQNVYS
jgi:hypothetical protein